MGQTVTNGARKYLSVIRNHETESIFDTPAPTPHAENVFYECYVREMKGAAVK